MNKLSSRSSSSSDSNILLSLMIRQPNVCLILYRLDCRLIWIISELILLSFPSESLWLRLRSNKDFLSEQLTSRERERAGGDRMESVKPILLFNFKLRITNSEMRTFHSTHILTWIDDTTKQSIMYDANIISWFIFIRFGVHFFERW